MKLVEWLDREKITRAEASRRFGVSHTTVARWCTGELLPGWDNLITIKTVTADCVRPDDFMPTGAA